MSCESRIFGHLLTSSQLILRRRVEQTAFLYETECSRNYATEITRLASPLHLRSNKYGSLTLYKFLMKSVTTLK
jgi:hypothetical protein